MDRAAFDKYIADTYGVRSEFPWMQYPSFAVYRHESNQKWFAVVMHLPRSKFGLADDGAVDVVNLKCDPIMTGSLCKENGIYPAYHMNKTYWISVFLDGSVEDDKLTWLLALSYNFTKPKRR